MPAKTPEQRLDQIEERIDAIEQAFLALMASDETDAEMEERDSLGSMAESCLAPDDYHLTQAERGGDINPRRRRVLRRAQWLLAGNFHTKPD